MRKKKLRLSMKRKKKNKKKMINRDKIKNFITFGATFQCKSVLFFHIERALTL